MTTNILLLATKLKTTAHRLLWGIYHINRGVCLSSRNSISITKELIA